MSRIEVLVAIRVAFKRTLRESDDILRAMANANQVACQYAGSILEMNELRREALKGVYYV